MDTWELCQIYIPNGLNGTLPNRKFYTCNLNGRYEATLIGISYADSTNAKDNRLIRVQSDSFRLLYGSLSQTIIFCNRSEHNTSFAQGEMPIMLECIGNNIDISIQTDVPYDGGANNNFNFCILTFKVKKLE